MGMWTMSMVQRPYVPSITWHSCPTHLGISVLPLQRRVRTACDDIGKNVRKPVLRIILPPSTLDQLAQYCGTGSQWLWRMLRNSKPDFRDRLSKAVIIKTAKRPLHRDEFWWGDFFEGSLAIDRSCHRSLRLNLIGKIALRDRSPTLLC